MSRDRLRRKVYVAYHPYFAAFFLTKTAWKEDKHFWQIGNTGIGEQCVELLEALGHEVVVIEDTSLEEP